MIGIAFAIWSKIPGPLKRVGAYAVILGLMLWAFKVFWLNPYANAIEEKSVAKVTEGLRDEFVRQHNTAVANFKKLNEDLEQRNKSLEASLAELKKSREAMFKGFDQVRTDIKKLEGYYNEKDRNIPDYLLGGRLRDVSNELECARHGNVDRTGCPDGAPDVAPTPGAAVLPGAIPGAR